MRKIIIIMMAIAFSLSAFSEEESIYSLDYGETQGAGLAVWCVNEYVFLVGIGHFAGGLTQMNHVRPVVVSRSDRGAGLQVRPMTCEAYKSTEAYKSSLRINRR